MPGQKSQLTSFLCKVECRGRRVASAGEADLLSDCVLGDVLFRVVDHRSRNVDGVNYQRVVRIALDQGNRETPLHLKSNVSSWLRRRDVKGNEYLQFEVLAWSKVSAGFPRL